jgi:hypothetical protein
MDNSSDLGFSRCPKCQAVIVDNTGEYEFKCPNCGEEFHEKLTSYNSLPPKIDAPKEIWRNLFTYKQKVVTITILMSLLLSLLLYFFYVEIIVGPQIGDQCYPRFGTLCDEQYCGGESFNVDPYEPCTITHISEHNSWYYLACDGHYGWDDYCSQGPKP